MVKGEASLHHSEIVVLTEILEDEKRGHSFKLLLCVSGFAVFMLLVLLTGAALAASLFDDQFFLRLGVSPSRQDEVATWGIGVLSVFFPLAGTCLIAWIGVHDCLQAMSSVIRVGRIQNERLFLLFLQRVQCSSNKASISGVIRSIATGG